MVCPICIAGVTAAVASATTVKKHNDEKKKKKKSKTLHNINIILWLITIIYVLYYLYKRFIIGCKECKTKLRLKKFNII